PNALSGHPVFQRIPATCAGLRLDQALSRMFPQFSRNRLQAWIKTQRVLLNGQSCAARQTVWGGEVASLATLTEELETTDLPEPIALDIVYQDDVLLVINKPAGLVVHPGAGNRSGTLLNALLYHAPGLAGVPRAGIVHRLDKDTSGLLVIAKTPAAHTDLVRQLQQRSVIREYLALVDGVVKSDGVIEIPVGRHPRQRTKMAVLAAGKTAVTYYGVEQSYARHTLLRCRLETGRTHQIRVHMQSIGHPLVGDPVYGSKATLSAGNFHRQALHATRLELIHPHSGRVMGWLAAPPDDMQRLLESLHGTNRPPDR
ncbi:MAG: 23S rRNA pseudouridine(1911/1915/1917) synthase RluD, partial [Burkholderiales bacterium]